MDRENRTQAVESSIAYKRRELLCKCVTEHLRTDSGADQEVEPEHEDIIAHDKPLYEYALKQLRTDTGAHQEVEPERAGIIVHERSERLYEPVHVDFDHTFAARAWRLGHDGQVSSRGNGRYQRRARAHYEPEDKEQSSTFNIRAVRESIDAVLAAAAERENSERRSPACRVRR
ncbi:hypothetical protein LTR24_010522 [Lithohypha guttulata]|uniref:Uncharacterized protein n=1 Tax=Lithohypha guttulata TaxID=1690604 RepID=A0ABR0JTK5_9EURO|nr:hypothetical protein LTR24_010522 [Lithohypha guttulata]